MSTPLRAVQSTCESVWASVLHNRAVMSFTAAVICLLCRAVLQYFNTVTKEYSIEMAADKQVIRHTLEHTLWRMAVRKSDTGGPAAAAAGGPAGKAPAAAAAAGAAGGAATAEKEGLVGLRIEVWWPEDKAFYAGKVTVSCIGTRKVLTMP